VWSSGSNDLRGADIAANGTGGFARPAVSIASCGRRRGPLSANVRVFIEIAAFDGNMAERLAKGPAIARSFAEWMNDPSSGVRRVGGMLATADTVTKMPLDVGAVGESASDGGDIRRWDLAITPHLGDPRSSEVRMDLDLAPAQPLGTPEGSWSIPDHRRARTTVVLQDQAPVVIGLEPAVSGVEKGRGWTLLMTPYVVRRDDDLRRLFECRMANRARVQR
jgi:hypothetical protein